MAKLRKRKEYSRNIISSVIEERIDKKNVENMEQENKNDKKNEKGRNHKIKHSKRITEANRVIPKTGNYKRIKSL